MVPADSRAISPQKLAIETFHVPAWRTAVPFWPASMGVPLIVIVYATAAWVADVSVTFCTVAPAVAPCGFEACALSTEANCEPFSTRPTLVAAGVLPLKNVTQVFLIAASAAAGVLAAEVVAEAVGVGDADGVAGAEVLAATVALGEVAAELLLELLELEHAVSAAAKARPNAGTSRARRAL